VVNVSDRQILTTLKYEAVGIPVSVELSDDLHYGVALTPAKRHKLYDISVFELETDKTKTPRPAIYEYKAGTKYKIYGATANRLLTNSLSIAVGLNGDLQMWDITGCKYEGNFFHDPSEKDTANPRLHNHGGKALNHVIVSEDRRFMVCGGADGVASVWDLGNEILMFNYKGHTAPVGI
jgi:WD40 repeat protein